MTPDGRFLYMTEGLGFCNLRGYGVQVDGSLSAIPGSPWSCSLESLYLQADPSSEWLFVSSRAADTGEAWSIDPVTGALTAGPVMANGGGPRSVGPLAVR